MKLYVNEAIYDQYHETYPQMRIIGTDDNYVTNDNYVTKITFSQGFGAMDFILDDDYESVLFEFEEMPSDLEIGFYSDLISREDEWYNVYYSSFYPASQYNMGFEFASVFDNQFSSLVNDKGQKASKFTKVSLANAAEGENVIYLNKVTFVKNNGASVVLKNSKEVSVS